MRLPQSCWNLAGRRREGGVGRERATSTLLGLMWRCPEAARNSCLERGREVRAEEVSVGGRQVHTVITLGQGMCQPGRGKRREPTNKLRESRG